MILRGFGLYSPTGVILFNYDRQLRGPNPHANGTKVWEWFVDHEACKTLFARALMAEPLPPQLLRMDTAKKKIPLTAMAHFLPTGIPTAPVCGAFSAFSDDVLSMTAREREVAKLLPTMPAKKIAAKLGVTESTINTLRQRIGERIGRTGPALIAALAELHEVL
jgi:DNA-binding CsgD family transcriptional regulator